MPIVGSLPALALVLGSIAGILTGLDPALVRPWLVLALALSIVCWRSGRASAAIACLTVGFLSGGIALGASAADRARDTELRRILDVRAGGFDIDSIGPEGVHDPMPATVTLLEDASRSGNAVSLRASLTALTVDHVARQVESAGVRITVSGVTPQWRMERWRAGRTYRVPVVFRRPARYLDAGVADFERDLAFDGVTLFGSVKSSLLVVEESRGSVISEAAASARAFVRAAVATHVSSRDPVAGAIVIAVLIGDRTALSDELRERLQAAGTYHVIAISGGNIAVLTGLVLAALAAAGVRGPAAALTTIAVLLAYGYGVVSGPSVWRATAVAVGYLVATVGDHRTPPWQAMMLAAAVMTMLDPLDVLSPGFILTFGASAALLEIARQLTSGVAPRKVSIVTLAVSSLMASAAVELALLPVSAQAFSRVSIAGLFLNLVAVPAMVVVQIAGMAVVALAWWPAGAHLAGTVVIWAAWALVESARLVEWIPMLSQRVPPPGFLVIGIYYAALLGTVWLDSRRRTAAASILLLAVVVIVAGPVSRWWPREEERLRLTMLDVGQAESLVLRVPGARPLLVDAGGAAFGGFDIGGRVIAPALWASGIYALESLLITHGDPDHIGGALRVTSDFSPSKLLLGVPMPAHTPTVALVDAARGQGSVVASLARGERFSRGRATVRVLHPPAPDWERRRVRNDDSVVLEVLYGDVAILLTGDIAADVEREILPLLTPAPIRILKVAHHGSRTSSSRELIEGWKPTIALISCGRGSQFGHPVREVLERLEAVGAQVYRTDRDGQITVTTDGRGVEVATYEEVGRRQSH